VDTDRAVLIAFLVDRERGLFAVLVKILDPQAAGGGEPDTRIELEEMRRLRVLGALVAAIMLSRQPWTSATEARSSCTACCGQVRPRKSTKLRTSWR
jgi:hypothetical protein